MRRSAVVWAGGAGLAGALMALAWPPSGSTGRAPSTVQLPGSRATAATPLAIRASPAPMSGLGHDGPPDPEALRNAPARQAAYDAEAKPGEFVTPPNVSVEH